jgi:threonine dehydratase
MLERAFRQRRRDEAFDTVVAPAGGGGIIVGLVRSPGPT